MAYMDNTIIGKLPVINKTRNSKMVKIESEKGKEFSMPYKKKNPKTSRSIEIVQRS